MTAPQTKLERFKTTFLEMSNLVVELFTVLHSRGFSQIHPNMLILGLGFLKVYSDVSLINNFINYSLPHWPKIRTQDASYFEHDADKIFEPLKTKYGINIDVVKTLYTAQEADGELVISRKDQDAVWLFFQTLVKIVLHYVHEGRGPVITEDLQGNKKVEYQNPNFHPEINLEEEAQLWKVRIPGLTI